jgi:hypothetical protein
MRAVALARVGGKMGPMVVSLLVISDREPLAWMLSEQRWAVPAGRVSSAPNVGDELLLYTTRGCYRNPVRDRGLVMGRATAVSAPILLPRAVSFRGREFALGFDVEIVGIAPLHQGVELGALAGQLELLPDPTSWGVRLRRSLIRMTERDAVTLSTALTPHLRPLHSVATDYVAAARAGRAAVQLKIG